MDIPSLTHDAPQLPDRVFEATMRGNLMLPQMFPGHVLLAGSTAVRLVLDKEATWSGCTATPTQDQTLRLGKAVNLAHKHYGIPHTFANSQTTPPVRNSFGSDRLHGIFQESAERMTTTVYNFAVNTLPEHNIVGSSQANTVGIFLSDNTYRLQANTLSALWETAASALLSETGRKLSRAYRQDMPRADTEATRKYTFAHLNPVFGLVINALCAEHSSDVRTDQTIQRFAMDIVFNGRDYLLNESARQLVRLGLSR